MNTSPLNQYANSEKEIVQELAREAARLWQGGEMSVRELIHHMFGVRKDSIGQAQLFGPINSAIQFSDVTAVTIWPHRDVAVADFHGYSFPEILELIEAGIVFPLIQEPFRYSSSPELSELIVAHRPPSYFWRGNMAYSIMCGGGADMQKVNNTYLSGNAVDWYNEGFENQTIMDAHLYRDTWEPNHKKAIPMKLESSHREYIRDSFSFKYLNACAFLGNPFVKLIVKELSPESALKFLTTFHILTDHPMSHALLTNAIVDLTSYEFQNFKENTTEYFCDKHLTSNLATLPLTLFAKPLAKDIRFLREFGVKPLPYGNVTQLGDFSKPELLALSNQLTESAFEYEEWVLKNTKVQGQAKKLIEWTIYGTNMGVATGLLPPESLYLTLLKILGDGVMVEHVTSSINKYNLDHLITKTFEA